MELSRLIIEVVMLFCRAVLLMFLYQSSVWGFYYIERYGMVWYSEQERVEGHSKKGNRLHRPGLTSHLLEERFHLDSVVLLRPNG